MGIIPDVMKIFSDSLENEKGWAPLSSVLEIDLVDPGKPGSDTSVDMSLLKVDMSIIGSSSPDGLLSHFKNSVLTAMVTGTGSSTATGSTSISRSGRSSLIPSNSFCSAGIADCYVALSWLSGGIET